MNHLSQLKRYLWGVSVFSFLTLAETTPGYAMGSNVDATAVKLFTTTVSSDLQGHQSVLAQNNNNEDRFLQPTPLPSPLPPQTNPPVEEPSQAVPSESEETENRITVETITVEGSTVLSEAEIQELTTPLQGKTVSLEELTQLTDAISQKYLERGFVTSRAVIVEESLITSNIKIQVLEGTLENIEVEGTTRLNANYIRSRIRLGAGTPLNTATLEDQLRLLRTDPLLSNVEASLKAGEGITESNLTVRVQENPLFHGDFSIDNYSPPSVGSERLGVKLRYLNLTGAGDRLAASFYHTTRSGSDTLELTYSRPLNAMNGTVQLRTSINQNEVVQEPFDVLDISGESELYEISYRQPLIRNPRQEFALSVGFTYQDGLTFLGNEQFGFSVGTEDGVSRTSIFKFGQDYTIRGGSGAWAFRSGFSFGTGIFDATINDDPTPDSRFFSWLLQIQRVQVLNPDNFLILQGDFQWTPDSLLPSQQFVIGGGQSVRGFRQNARSGDNGFRISIEDRLTLQRDEGGDAIWQLAPFIEAGSVWNADNNPNATPDQTFLAGIGLGVLWRPIENLNVRVDFSLPLVELDDRGVNAQDDGIYFSVNYGW